MRPKVLNLAPTVDADADGVAESQTPAAGGAQSLTLDGTLVSGGVATFDIPRRVAITSAADETARTFTVTGTDRFGNSISEAITGLDTAAASSLLDFATVTAITTDDDTTGAITAGTTGVASSAWFVPDRFADEFNIGIGCNVSGTANYDIEVTYDNLLAATFSPSDLVTVFNHGDLVNETTDQHGSQTVPVAGIRVTVNSFTASTTPSVAATLVPKG